jgi:hypothetical protein
VTSREIRIASENSRFRYIGNLQQKAFRIVLVRANVQAWESAAYMRRRGMAGAEQVQ